MCKKFGLLLVAFLCAFQIGYVRTHPQDKSLSDDYHDDDPDQYEYDDDTVEDKSLSPTKFISESMDITAKAGEDVSLPCEATNPDTYVTIWYKNKIMLYQDTIPMGKFDYRFKILPDKTLMIHNVSEIDRGEYNCSIMVNPPKNISHRLDVQFEPKIIGIHPSHAGKDQMNYKTEEIGKSLELKCVAVGNPAPKIVWSKNGQLLESVKEDNTYFIEKLSRHDAGTYQCLADNGIGKAAHAHVEVRVNHAPVIEIDRTVVPTGENYTSDLQCVAHFHPVGIMEWLRHGSRINQNDPRVQEIRKSHHHVILKIKHTRKSDFGVYTCYARNSLGDASANVTLTGSPGIARFMTGGLATDNRSPTLSWSVESFSPIEKFELQYKKMQDGNWNTVDSVEVNVPIGNQYVANHTLANLEPGSYEARLRAKNIYGWSDYSNPSQFSGEPLAAIRDNSASKPLTIAPLILFAVVLKSYL